MLLKERHKLRKNSSAPNLLPLIAWSAASYGIGASVVSAKLFASACGAILHLTERHQALALLSLGYIAAALWPWTLLLWP